MQDDYLDSFGNPSTFGKQTGGDILANKKTFLLVKALENAGPENRKTILDLLHYSGPDKVQRMIDLFRDAGVGPAAQTAKMNYMENAFKHLDSIRVPAGKKDSLKELAAYLLERDI